MCRLGKAETLTIQAQMFRAIGGKVATERGKKGFSSFKKKSLFVFNLCLF